MAKMDVSALRMEDLWTYLSYMQALADKYEEMLKTIDYHVQHNNVTESEVLILRNKIYNGYKDADDVTIKLESELDKRAKKLTGIRYGSKTLTALTKDFYKMLEANKNNAGKKGPDISQKSNLIIK